MDAAHTPFIVELPGQQGTKRLARFRITGYRIFVSATTLTWWTVKGIQVCYGGSLLPSLLGWAVVVVMVVVIVYLGRLAKTDPPIWPEFYYKDYSREVIYLPLRTFGLFLAAFCAVNFLLCLPLFGFVLPLAVLSVRGMRRTALFVSCGVFMMIALFLMRILILLQSGRRRNKAVLLLKNGEQATERVRSLPGILDGCAVAIGTFSALYLYYTTLFHSSMHLIRDIADRSR